ncbi:MAG: DUF3179 domain-containing protein [Alphaproteobacteria bacterium]
MLTRCAFLALVGLVAMLGPAAAGGADMWRSEWPNTDFSRTAVDFDEITSGGPPKDGIPSIDAPQFDPVGDPAIELSDHEPVIAFIHDGDARAYPLRVLMFHEIVNDEVGSVPVAVTYCPLCNASKVFDRRLDGRVYDFGTTGKLRNSDLVMYDRQTESWWQQFSGEGIVGTMTGARLAMLPSRLMPYGLFASNHPDGLVLRPPGVAVVYGRNPYAFYDTAPWPFMFHGDYDLALAPLDYVLVVGEEGWSLDLLQRRGRIETPELVIEWQAGMSSALDEGWIPNGRDIGHVTVETHDGRPVVHDLTFAFAFVAFNPEGVLHH